MEGW